MISWDSTQSFDSRRPIGNCNNTALLQVWLVLAPLLLLRDQERARVLVYPRGSWLLIASRYQPCHIEERYLLYNRTPIPPGGTTGQERRDRVEPNAAEN
jgi:hypothetical protein